MTGVNPETGLYDTDEETSSERVGIIDWRNRRPRRVDLADQSPIGAAYHRGYDIAPHMPGGWT